MITPATFASPSRMKSAENYGREFTVKMTTYPHRSAVTSSPDRAKMLEIVRQVIRLLIPWPGLAGALWVLRRLCRANTNMPLCLVCFPRRWLRETRQIQALPS